jgi:hypothetical protein
MRDDYKLKGTLKKLQVEIEQQVGDVLTAMEKHSKFSVSELTNTALKRFISAHKDFLPPQGREQTKKK